MKLKLTNRFLSDKMNFIKSRDMSKIDIHRYNVVELESDTIPVDLLYHFDSINTEDPDVVSVIQKYNFIPVDLKHHYVRPLYFFMNTERPRLGNFISELIHIIYHCEITKTPIYFPDTPGTFIINTIFRPFLGFTNNIFVDIKPRNFDTIVDGKNFYYFPKYIPLEQERRNIGMKYISTQLPSPIITEYDLVIHIRSGDIFNGNHHPDYIQPPFEYYVYIIKTYHYQNVLILSEPDFSNPVIGKLKQTFSFITVSSGDLQTDVGIMLGARHLVIGTGSFGYMLSLCSSHLLQLYCFERHNVYYKNSDYNITVLGVNGDYPTIWNGDTKILTDGNWDIIEKNMNDFVERPKRLWSD
jgi:hypothetical protein